MLFDMRTYTVRPGTLKSHLSLYEEHGWKVQSQHLGEPLAYLVTETGPLNTYTHIWSYADAADRAQRRAAMEKDTAWIAYRTESSKAGFLTGQENRLMVPAPFFKPPTRG